MHPELDNLVKAYEAFQVANPEEISRLRAIYRALLNDVAIARR